MVVALVQLFKSAAASRVLMKNITSPSSSKKAAPKTPSKKATPASKAVISPKMTGKGSEKVRVWWPPTTNRKKTDVSGMYWPAKVISYLSATKVYVEYDNKEKEQVSKSKVVPFNAPVQHGKETVALTPGEFCEVHNDSARDPAEWVACVKSVKGNKFTLHFPFHDTEDEVVDARCVRRARLFDHSRKTWCYVKPGQTWKDGDVSAPSELVLQEEKEFFDNLLGRGEISSPMSKAEAASAKAKKAEMEAKLAQKEAELAVKKAKEAALKAKAEMEAEEARTKKAKGTQSAKKEPKAGDKAKDKASKSRLPVSPPSSPAPKATTSLNSAAKSVVSPRAAAPPKKADLNAKSEPVKGEKRKDEGEAPASAAKKAKEDKPSAPTATATPPAATVSVVMPAPSAAPESKGEAKGNPEGKTKGKRAADASAGGHPNKKKQRDRDLPKRAMNAYLFFLGAHRDQVSKENPGKSAQELLALTAELWQKVSPEEKAKFQKEADADLARYRKEMEVYHELVKLRPKPELSPRPKSPEPSNTATSALLQAMQSGPPPPIMHAGPPPPGWMPVIFPVQAACGSTAGVHPGNMQPNANGDAAAQGAKGKKEKRDPNMPKKGHSAYICFSKAFHSQQREIAAAMKAAGGAERNLDFNSMSKKIGEAWRDLSHEDRQVYYDIAKSEAKRFQEEMTVYNQTKKAETTQQQEVPMAAVKCPPADSGATLQGAQIDAPPPPAFMTPPVVHTIPPPGLIPPPQDNTPAAESTAAPSTSTSTEPTPGPVLDGVPIEKELASLDSLNMPKLRAGLQKCASEDAYYRIVDKLRTDDRRLVLEANEMHIHKKKRPDWKAFLVHVIGYADTCEVYKEN